MGLGKLVRNVGAGIAGIALATALNAADAQAGEYKADGWATPQILTATRVWQRKHDIIKDIPGKETLQTVYKTPQGTFFNTLELNGRLYGFLVDTDGKPPMEYGIYDGDGDGTFRYRMDMDETMETPAYLKSDKVVKVK